MHEQYTCHQPKVALGLEIQAPRGKERQWGVGAIWADGSMYTQYYIICENYC